MKTTQYMRQEARITGFDHNGIAQRRLWGLRLLHDDNAFTVYRGVRSTQLKKGTIEKLIAAAQKKGIKLSESEIRRRLQCARAYPSDVKFSQALTEFHTWWDLIQLGFPEVEGDDDDPESDWRDDAEKAEQQRKKLALLAGLNSEPFLSGVSWPSEFDPDETPVKDMVAHVEDQDRITAGFVAAGEKRHAYLDPIVEKLEELGLDLETSWAEAHRLTYGDVAELVEDDESE